MSPPTTPLDLYATTGTSPPASEEEPAATLKRCGRCRIERQRSTFALDRSRADGLQNRCRACNRLRREEHLEEDRARGRRYYEEHAEERRERQHDYAVANPDKASAHRAVRDAVADGRLTRPTHCERCGLDKYRIQAHHADHGAPLDVTWLCASCHKLHHAAERRAELAAAA